ncbi:MAG TPA: Stk1 family PASTA domain-containing Ser/Thr kinase [Candidatus Onthomonas avicola]|nr:Stk1 family PASTA domain-containing Ser/Thr kinase [Candidatus Onthomonas avicola]
MDQYIGKMLDDRYEILEVIGTGGMAVVYKAKCHRLNRMVAIKILRPDLMLDDDIRRRFHDEAQAVAMLSSPNIVSVYDVGQVDGADYIVMELIEGITLKEYMEKRGDCLNWREALHFMTQIMQALRHAHSRGIVHRDIKPQNIMVLRDGSVKVADFGIARIMDSQKTLTQEAFGSVHYVSPEQAKGNHVDARSDIYSAGVVLYEMLTGTLPFDGDTAVSIAIQHINSVPVEPRKRNPDIPVGMEQICMKMMCANLELRYQDAQTVLKDLEEFRRNPNIVFSYPNPWGGKRTDTAYLRSTPPQPARRPERAPVTAPPEPYPDQPPEESEEEEYDEREHRRKVRGVFIGAVVAIVAVIVIIFFVLWNNLISDLLAGGEVYEVPTLLGMTIDEAKEYIATEYEGRFEVICTAAQFDETAEAGDIISQSPTGGSSTKSELTTIEVVVSSGIQQENTVYMPSVVGRDYREVQSELENEYNVTVVVAEDRVSSNSIEVDAVVSTDPVAGTPLEEGQTVTLILSSGPEVTTVRMPNLIGMQEEDAVDAITEAGLEAGRTIVVASSEEAGEVIYQSVSPYTEVEPGTMIYLQISDGSLSSGDDQQDDGQETDTPDEEETPDEPVISTPVYQVTVQLPDYRDSGTSEPSTDEGETGEEETDAETGSETEESTTTGQTTYVTVTITINGSVYLNGSYEANGGTVETIYTGEIDSISVQIDGAETENFSYVQTGTNS